jgi:hypothetical protein
VWGNPCRFDSGLRYFKGLKNLSQTWRVFLF